MHVFARKVLASLVSGLMLISMALTIPTAALGVSPVTQAQNSITQGKSSALGQVLPQENAASAYWGSFRKGLDNNAVVDALTPQAPQATQLAWSYRLKAASEWDKAVSDPLIIGDNLYIVVGQELQIVSSDSKLLDAVSLAAPANFAACRPIYADGIIAVPLDGGRVQAIEVSSLTTKWTTDPIESDDPSENYQSISTLSYKDGRIYAAATAMADWSSTSAGVFTCIDAQTGQEKWSYKNNDSGYYWSGATFAGDAVIFIGDDGQLVSKDATAGTPVDTLDIGVECRSTTVSYEGSVFFTTTKKDENQNPIDGALHKVVVNSDGTFGNHTEISFGSSSSSTPAICNGVAYVGGGTADYKGVLAVIDTNTMLVKSRISAPAAVQSSPLISRKSDGGISVYFTANAEPGGVYGANFAPGASTGTANMIYTPTGDNANWCMASVIAGENGVLYYTNDSGMLFALKAGANPVPPAPKPLPASLASAKVTLQKSIFAYTGKQVKPKVTKVVVGGKTLKANTDYTVSYATNKLTGKGTVKISGKGAYTGTRSAAFNIAPKKSKVQRIKSPKKRQLTLWWKKDLQATGYQIQYSTNKKFSKGTKTITVTSRKTASRTVKRLKSKKVYYVRVRAYKTIDKKKVTIGWSPVKKVRVK